METNDINQQFSLSQSQNQNKILKSKILNLSGIVIIAITVVITSIIIGVGEYLLTQIKGSHFPPSQSSSQPVTEVYHQSDQITQRSANLIRQDVTVVH